MLLEGLQLPLTTPFFADGRLNLRKLEHNVDRYSKTLATGLLALSAVGEATMLSDEETRLTLGCVSDAAAAEKVLVAGVSRDSVAGTLDLAEFAAKVGYDAVLVRRPSFLRGGAARDKELLSYFQMVADRSALPVVLDSRSGEELGVEVIVELAAHPRVIGLVDGVGGRERIESLRSGTSAVKREVTVTAVFAAVTARMQADSTLVSTAALTGGGGSVAVAPSVKTRTKVVGFQILAGGTAGLLEGLLAGAVGAAPGFAACAPQACYEVLAAWKDGDHGLAEEQQERLRAAALRVEGELGVAGVKYGCDLNGYYGGLPRLPRLPLTGAERNEVEGLMQGLRS
jgi:4-hydroxy-2-oxoglutarate aldolase